MKTRVRRDKGIAWTALLAVLALPAVVTALWTRELRSAAPPATTPKRVLAVNLRTPPLPEPDPVPATPPPIRLEGLILSENAPRRAIVNGIIVQEGQTVDGATVVRIEAGEVHFRSAAGEFTRRLGG